MNQNDEGGRNGRCDVIVTHLERASPCARAPRSDAGAENAAPADDHRSADRISRQMPSLE